MKLSEIISEHKKGRRAVKHNAKPRNPVAHAAQTVAKGSGPHKDKKKAEKQGETKHKKEYSVEGFVDATNMSRRDVQRLGHEDDDTPSQYGVFINGKLWKKFATRDEANRVSLAIERKHGKPTSVRSL